MSDLGFDCKKIVNISQLAMITTEFTVLQEYADEFKLKFEALPQPRSGPHYRVLEKFDASKPYAQYPTAMEKQVVLDSLSKRLEHLLTTRGSNPDLRSHLLQRMEKLRRAQPSATSDADGRQP